MGKIIYISGGARSGKSSFAENIALNVKEKIIYIATLNFFDEEMKYRIEKHKERRNENFEVVETYKNFPSVFSKLTKETILLDCVSNMVNNFMFENNYDWDEITGSELEILEKNIVDNTKELINQLKKHQGISIIVSNELGMGLVPPYALGRHFRDITGRINQQIAKEASEAYFLVSGIPLKIKGE